MNRRLQEGSKTGQTQSTGERRQELMTCNTWSSSKLKRQVWSLILKVKRESLFPKFNFKIGSWKLRTTGYLHSECSDGIVQDLWKETSLKKFGEGFYREPVELLGLCLQVKKALFYISCDYEK